ncbi:acyl-CoA dehydrogenase [Rhodococcus sp. BP-241]|uniref:acyl-CoA dehydrogenase n=1 Tax=Rhodococcus sp. BP-241 TaxID=2739441 RepID=UPI0035AC1E3D
MSTDDLDPGVAAAVRSRIASAGEIPLPGSGATRRRWDLLTAWCRDDAVVGRLLEAHFDAVAICAELGGPATSSEQMWGVWAAETPPPVDAVSDAHGSWSLTGRKMWCSGAHSCSHALVTARAGEDSALFAVALDSGTVTPEPNTWHATGMRESDSGAVSLAGTSAVAVGQPGDYTARAGFWHGAIGVAACWFGVALAVADPLYRRAAADRAGPHALAHLGAVDAALTACVNTFDVAAGEVDRDPLALDEARVRAMRVRAIVERACTEVLDRVGRALGAAPLGLDAEHSRRVADLTTYLRQSHAEVDLENLGRAVAASGSAS